jgi:hypothetical protein
VDSIPLTVDMETGEFLWRQRNFGFYEVVGIPWLADELSGSE